MKYDFTDQEMVYIISGLSEMRRFYAVKAAEEKDAWDPVPFKIGLFEKWERETDALIKKIVYGGDK